MAYIAATYLVATGCQSNYSPDPGEQLRQSWSSGYHQCQANFSGDHRWGATECHQIKTTRVLELTMQHRARISDDRVE